MILGAIQKEILQLVEEKDVDTVTSKGRTL